jgi:Acetyl-CoA hydrolase/transferase C-terminal domain
MNRGDRKKLWEACPYAKISSHSVEDGRCSGGRRGARPADAHPGAIVTTHKNVVDKIVREHGVAELRGRTIRQRAARRDDTGLPRRRLHRPASLQESLDTI